MKYSNPKSSGRNILHQFTKGESTIGGKKWSKVDLTFSELHTNGKGRSFVLTIRYNNPDTREFKLNQFTIHGEDDMRQIYDVIGNVLNNPPVFTELP